MQKKPARRIPLEVQVLQEEKGTCVVQCAGEVDLATVARFRDALDQALHSASRRVIVDFSRVTFVDSAGVGQIVAACKRLRAGAELCVRTNSQHIRMLLQIAGLGKLLALAGEISASTTGAP